LATVFSYAIAQMTSLMRDHLDNPRQFGSVKDLYSNYTIRVSPLPAAKLTLVH
jgi:hypothetical protein